MKLNQIMNDLPSHLGNKVTFECEVAIESNPDCCFLDDPIDKCYKNKAIRVNDLDLVDKILDDGDPILVLFMRNAKDEVF